MGQRVIPVAVTAEYVGGDGVTLGAAGSHNSVVIEYDFRAAGPMWDDVTVRYVLWTNPQGNTTNRVNLGVDKLVPGYDNKVYHASPTADAMCVSGWAEMVVVGAIISDGNEVIKVKTEPSRFRVLPGSSSAADNEGIAATVADQLQSEIETVDSRKVNKPVTPYDPNGEEGQYLVSLGDGRTKWVDMELDRDLIEDILESHPDWVTTVQGHSLTKDHLVLGTLGFVTPEMYGATGDGETDDSTPINEALQSGHLVVFGQGKKYSISAPIRILSDTTLELNHAEIICKCLPSIFNFYRDDSFTGYDGNGRITIRNGKISGGTISLFHGDNILFEHIEFSNTVGNHFIELCACRNVKILHCSFVGMKHSDGTREYVNFDPCVPTAFPWADENSGMYDGTVCDTVTISNCVFSVGSGEYTDCDDFVGQHYHPDTSVRQKNVTIEGNRFLGDVPYAVRMRCFENSIVRNNYMRTLSSHGVQLGQGKNNIITGNDCQLSSNSAFCIMSGGGEENLVIADNTLASTLTNFVPVISGSFTDASFKALQKTYISDPQDTSFNSNIPFTLVNRIYLYNGTVSSGKFMQQTICSFPDRNFQCGEAFPMKYMIGNSPITETIGTITIDSEDPQKATTSVAVRFVFVETV